MIVQLGYITQMWVVGGILSTYPLYLETCFALEHEIMTYSLLSSCQLIHLL